MSKHVFRLDGGYEGGSRLSRNLDIRMANRRRAEYICALFPSALISDINNGYTPTMARNFAVGLGYPRGLVGQVFNFIILESGNNVGRIMGVRFRDVGTGELTALNVLINPNGLSVSQTEGKKTRINPEDLIGVYSYRTMQVMEQVVVDWMVATNPTINTVLGLINTLLTGIETNQDVINEQTLNEICVKIQSQRTQVQINKERQGQKAQSRMRRAYEIADQTISRYYCGVDGLNAALEVGRSIPDSDMGTVLPIIDRTKIISLREKIGAIDILIELAEGREVPGSLFTVLKSAANKFLQQQQFAWDKLN